MELDIFSIPFNVAPASAPSELQLEFIKLQSDDTLKAMYLNKPLLEFYRVHVSKEKLPNLELALSNDHLSLKAHIYANNFFLK